MRHCMYNNQALGDLSAQVTALNTRDKMDGKSYTVSSLI